MKNDTEDTPIDDPKGQDEGETDSVEEQGGEESGASPSKKGGTKKRGAQSSKKRERSEAAATAGAANHGGGKAAAGAVVTMPRAVLFAAATLLIGAGLGWTLRDARAEEEAVAEDSAAPCDTWKDEICNGTSEESAACVGANAAAGMLPKAACNVALADVPATLDKIKAARASCDELVKKLCTDLGEQSTGCQLVTAKTPSIPPEGCEEMLGKYDEVLAQLKQIGQGAPGMRRPGGPPPGMRRPSGPPPAGALESVPPGNP